MKFSQVFLTALILSVLFSAITTELSMRVSTGEAMSVVNEMDLSDEGLADLHVRYEPIENDSSDKVEPIEIDPAEIKESMVQIQQNTSVYQYPGYWMFWFKSFMWLFLTALVVALIQSHLILKSVKKQSRLD